MIVRVTFDCQREEINILNDYMEDIKQCPNDRRIKHHPFPTIEKECEESEEEAIDTRMTTEGIPTGIDERIIRAFDISSFKG